MATILYNFVSLIKQIRKVSRSVFNEPRENKTGIKREWPREEGLVRVVTRVCTCHFRAPCICEKSIVCAVGQTSRVP